MAYTVHQAKTHFSRLLKEAEAGKEVVVMRGKKPVAKIVAMSEPLKTKRKLAGLFEGIVTYDDKIFDPMTDEELVEYGFDCMVDGALEQPPAR
jgi:prevent-host-death family protein